MVKQKNVLLKVIMLGASKVGKTSLINQYVNKNFDKNYKETVSANFQLKEMIIDDRIVMLQIWEINSLERRQTNTVFRHADCCVLVFDVTSQASFKSLNTYLNGFLEQASPSDPDNFPFILFGNKVDVIEKRTVTSETAKQWCHMKNDILYFETSAEEITIVEQAFSIIITENALNKWSNFQEIQNSMYNEVSLAKSKNVENSNRQVEKSNKHGKIKLEDNTIMAKNTQFADIIKSLNDMATAVSSIEKEMVESMMRVADELNKLNNFFSNLTVSDLEFYF